MYATDMPGSFRSALAADPAAAAAFNELTPAEKLDWIERARSCRGRRETDALAAELRSYI